MDIQTHDIYNLPVLVFKVPFRDIIVVWWQSACLQCMRQDSGFASQQPLTTKKVSFKKRWEPGSKLLLPSLTTWIQPQRIHMVEKKPISHKLSDNLCIHVRLHTHAQYKFKHFLKLGKSWKQSLTPKVLLVFSGVSTVPYKWCKRTRQLQRLIPDTPHIFPRTRNAFCAVQGIALRTNPIWWQYRVRVAWAVLGFTIIQISSDKTHTYQVPRGAGLIITLMVF